MITDYDGAAVFDADGNKIGTVERTYVDDSRTSQFVEVKMGSLFHKHRLVPLDEAQTEKDGLHVPLSRVDIERSPDVSDLGDGIDAGMLSLVRAYYSGDAGAAPTAEQAAGSSGDGEEDDTESPSIGDRVAGAADAFKSRLGGDGEEDTPTVDTIAADGGVSTDDPTAVRDLGDVVEVPIVEEEIVKRPVVKEVVRVRKDSVTETQTAEGDLRREDVEAEYEEPDDDEGLGARLGRALGNVGSKISGNGDSSPATDPTGGETYRKHVSPMPSSTGGDAPPD